MATCSRTTATLSSFNPFFIRASVYWPPWTLRKRSGKSRFQSLLHQGISLLIAAPRTTCSATASVSIPSSSGHQFTVSPCAHCPCGIGLFQSLLHQGISLLAGRCLHAPIVVRFSFNPFFIRASVYWSLRPCPKITLPVRFNPFFIRASVYWPSVVASVLAGKRRFNPFFIRASVYWAQYTQFHRGKAAQSFNPFFIRASVY